MGRKGRALRWIGVGFALSFGLAIACGDDAQQQDATSAGNAGEASLGGAPDGSAGSSSSAGDVGDAGGSDPGQGGTQTQGGAPAAASGAGGDETVGAAGASAGAGGDASSEPGCPLQPPADNSPCETASDLTCGYGSDPRPNCRQLYRCMEGAWDFFDDGVCDGSSQDCPAGPTNPPPNVCSNIGISCVYPATNQVCDCRGIPTADTWWCSESPGPNCPLPMPNYGTACDSAVTCVYKSVFCSQWEVECVDGRWRAGGASGGGTCEP
jgi:hypothetical protein